MGERQRADERHQAVVCFCAERPWGGPCGPWPFRRRRKDLDTLLVDNYLELSCRSLQCGWL